MGKGSEVFLGKGSSSGQMYAMAPTEEPAFRRRLRNHFACDPTELTTLS